METFSALLAICTGNSPVAVEFPAQRPVTRNFDVFCDILLNKRLSKQRWCSWFDTPSCPVWRHCNDMWEKGALELLPRGPEVNRRKYSSNKNSVGQLSSARMGWVGVLGGWGRICFSEHNNKTINQSINAYKLFALQKYMFVFSIIAQYQYSTDSFPWNTGVHVFYIVNFMVADGIVLFILEYFDHDTIDNSSGHTVDLL